MPLAYAAFIATHMLNCAHGSGQSNATKIVCTQVARCMQPHVDTYSERVQHPELVYDGISGALWLFSDDFSNRDTTQVAFL
jgi:hypothetical protein